MAVCDSFFSSVCLLFSVALSQVRLHYSDDLAEKICHISSFNCLFFDLYCFTFWFSRNTVCWTMIYNLFFFAARRLLWMIPKMEQFSCVPSRRVNIDESTFLGQVWAINSISSSTSQNRIFSKGVFVILSLVNIKSRRKNHGRNSVELGNIGAFWSLLATEH